MRNAYSSAVHRVRMLAWAALALLGCAASSPSTAVPARAPEPVPEPAAQVAESVDVAAESSVKPGINDPYFAPEGPDRYTRILEAETREIVQRRSDIVAAIGLRAGMIAADIGAGTGLLTIDMAKQVGPRGAVYAVDIVPAFLDRIRQRARVAGLDNVIVVRGEERATGLAPASLDLAFMCDTYHHIEYPSAYMRSLFESLRPGGTLVLVDVKRGEGASPSTLRHIRADKATVIAEVEQAGFVFESETDLLVENYYLHFKRPAR
jgi:predicted methyltransferase